jgi:hypothetical protein
MTDIEIAIAVKNIARKAVREMAATAKNARPRTDYGELLGRSLSDSPELRALKIEKGKLDIKALKAFASSPKQKEIIAERDKLQQKIKEMEEKERRP